MFFCPCPALVHQTIGIVVGTTLPRAAWVSKVGGRCKPRPANFDYSSALASDHDRYDVVAGDTRKLAHLNIDLAAGCTKLRLHDGAADKDGPLLSGTLAWQPNPRGTFGARHHLDYQFSQHLAWHPDFSHYRRTSDVFDNAPRRTSSTSGSGGRAERDGLKLKGTP